jgi:two-component system sensor histidine kinase YesM
MLSVGIFALHYSYKNNMNNAITHNRSTLQLLNEELNVYFTRCMELGSLIKSEAMIQRQLRHPLPEDRKSRYLEELTISEHLNFIHNYTVKDVFGIYVIGVNKALYRSNSLVFQKESFSHDTFFRKTIDGQDPVWNHTEGQSIAVKVIDENFISVSLPINDKLTNAVTGIVVIEIETRVLQRYIDSAAPAQQGSIFLTAGKQILCYAGSTSLIEYSGETTGPKMNRRMFLAPIDSDKYMSDYITTISGMEVISAVPLRNIRFQSMTIISILLVVIIIVIVLSLITDYFISSFLTKPVKELSEKMNLVEKGNLNIHLEPKYHNEIGHLRASFNSMIDRTRELMEKIIAEQQKSNELRYEILQEQIKPHFMYNTLDSAIWLSRDNQNDKVIKLISSLSNMLRLSLNDGKDIITIGEEKKQISNYLSILKIRYNEKLNYSIKVPLEAEKFLIPKLTLQPFIENAVYHGIKNKKNGGIVATKCHIEQGHLHFTVHDTGVGIEEEDLEELNKGQPPKGSGKNGIGIRNVTERLSLYFKDESRVWLESVVDRGTTVHIIIPQKKVIHSENT